MTQVRLLSAAVLAAFSCHAAAATFVWDAKNSNIDKHVPKVTLANKAVLEEVRGAEMFDQSVTSRAATARQKSELVKNDFARIESAYPNAQKAAVAVMSDSCSGSACAWTNVTVVVPQGGDIKTYHLTSPARITLTVDGDNVVGGAAEGIPAGTDKYGSQVTVTRQYLPKVGFVAPGFKPEFAKLVGEHPDQFFEDKALREPFANAVGLENFRDLRTAIGVASPSYLVQGRYVVLQGCMPHDCGGNYSFVMIDAVTADYYWARYNEGANRYSGSSKKIDKAAMQAVLMDEEFKQNDDARLVVTPAGKIVFKKTGR